LTVQIRLRTDGLTWREIDDELVVLDVVRSNYLATNEAGRLLWRSLASGTTRDDLVRELSDAFELEVETACADVDRFLDELRAQALLAE
jgi:coenzyme PQQ synthesis protein D (PqqD)